MIDIEFIFHFGPLSQATRVGSCFGSVGASELKVHEHLESLGMVG